MTTKSKAEAIEILAAQEEAKKRAARQAAVVEVAQIAPEMVSCRVLPMGDGRVSMGVHVAGIGEAHYEKGETFPAEKSIAQALEARGFVEIQG